MIMDEAVQLVEQDSLYGIPFALFSVRIGNGAVVHMSVERTPYRNDKRTVVVVDAAKFVSAWQAYPFQYQSIAFMTKTQWKADPKYSDAEKGFSHGAKQPVPLANVGVHISADDEHSVSVAFSNGITRTIWLLANGAIAFPVECSNREEAEALGKAVGFTHWTPKTVAELTPDST